MSVINMQLHVYARTLYSLLMSYTTAAIALDASLNKDNATPFGAMQAALISCTITTIAASMQQ